MHDGFDVMYELCLSVETSLRQCSEC